MQFFDEGKYCSAAKVFWPTLFCLFGTDANKCHIVMIFIVFFFSENKDCDAKILIPTNRESYHNHNICQSNHNMIFLTILCSCILMYTNPICGMIAVIVGWPDSGEIPL